MYYVNQTCVYCWLFYIIASNFKFELGFGIANDLWRKLPCNGNAVRTIDYIGKDFENVR